METTNTITVRAPEAVTTTPDQNDAQLVGLWLHGRPETTREAYQRDVGRFLAYLDGEPLEFLALPVLQRYADALEEGGFSLSSRRRMLSAIKSLLSFGQETGYLRFNVGKALRVPKGAPSSLASRIISEAEAHRVIDREPDARNRVILLLLYASGTRVSGLCALRWLDTAERSEGRGQITVTEKGGKTHSILLSRETWEALIALRPDQDGDEAPVFVSRKRGALQRCQVGRIVKTAGGRAGLDKLSPHWFRHAHASHALERGAPIHLVMQTLGHASVKTTSTYLQARPDDSSALYLGV